MNIQLTDDYRLKADTYNYILQKKNIVQDEESENYGKEVWHTIGYYWNPNEYEIESIDTKIGEVVFRILEGDSNE